MSCKQTTNTPINQEEDPCSGVKKSTECIVHEEALVQLGLSANSTQKEINNTISLSLFNLSNQSLTGYLTTDLPSTAVIGQKAYVTDADTPAYLQIVVGGGSDFCPVIYDGTNWLCN